VHRAWPALVLLLCSAARGQAPAYSAAGIVNAANFAPGPFAANSVLSIFGSNLSNRPDCKKENGVSSVATAGNLPTQLDNVAVYVANMPAPVLFVSPCQINFLVPTEFVPGTLSVTVVKQGLHGPRADITLVSGAPALFSVGDGYAIAQHSGYTLITPQVPAHSGDIVIVYATGLGRAGHNPTGQIPSAPAQIENFAALKVYLAGSPVDPSLIKYAGLTPEMAGLYQINMVLPPDLPPDPEIRVAIGDHSSPAGLKLALR
jgi:uncharacterized protein (TIGR03437 family)